MEIKAESRTQKRMATFLKAFAVWAQKNAFSVFPVPAGCGCCFEQLRQTGADVVSNPRHADVLLVGGALSRKAASTVRRLYDQMPEPKYVVAWGGCAASGGLFVHYPLVSALRAEIAVDAHFENRADAETAVRAELLLDGERVWAGEEVSLAPGADRVEKARFAVETPRLWHPYHPELYTLTARLVSGFRSRRPTGV